jgi:hypothetical protein
VVSRSSLHEPLRDGHCGHVKPRNPASVVHRLATPGGRRFEGVGDDGERARMHDHACLRVAVESTTGLDLRHQYEPVVLGEVEEVVGVEGFIWNLMATQICNGWHAGW